MIPLTPAERFLTRWVPATLRAFPGNGLLRRDFQIIATIGFWLVTLCYWNMEFEWTDGYVFRLRGWSSWV